MEKYGNAASNDILPRELLLGQSEKEVEYDRAGRIVKGQILARVIAADVGLSCSLLDRSCGEISLPRSKYEEDVYFNNHTGDTTVWGSWWKDHQWGYKCYKQTIRNSYCTGAGGIEAEEASSDPMKANIARKEAVEDTHAPVGEKKLATWGTEVPEDLTLDQRRLTEALKKLFGYSVGSRSSDVLIKFILLFEQEEEKRGEEKDERKRKYNVKYNNEATPEEMEAYRMKRIHQDDPMKDFLH